jgi:hypothetical protein
VDLGTAQITREKNCISNENESSECSFVDEKIKKNM